MDLNAQDIGSPAGPGKRKTVVFVAVAIAVVLALCVLAPYFARLFTPSRLLLGHQGEVYVYVQPEHYRAGEMVDLIVSIDQEDAKATAIRELTLTTTDGTELLATGRIFEDPPWGDTLWGDEGDIEDEFPVQLPADIKGELATRLRINYVEARSGRKGAFHNEDVFITLRVNFQPTTFEP